MTQVQIDLGMTCYGGIVDVVRGILIKTWEYIASYNGESLPGRWLSDRDEYAPGTTPTTGAEVAYELATPIEVTLTPTQIRSFSGYNYIESSTGEMEVEYITEGYQPLVDLIEANSGKHVYSTEEKVVGTWIDGKTIYEKTYTNATEQSVSYQTWTPTVISATDIDRIVNLFTTRDADGGTYIPVVTRKENGYVEIFAAVGWTYNNITIQYTKTSSNNRSLSKGATDSLRAEISGVKGEGEEILKESEKALKIDESESIETKEEADETEENADEVQNETVTE